MQTDWNLLSDIHDLYESIIYKVFNGRADNSFRVF